MFHALRPMVFIVVAAYAATMSPLTHVAAQTAPAARAGSAKPQSLRACSLLTKAEIKKVTGTHTPALFEQIPGREESLASGGTECFYPGITIQLDAHPVTAFEATRKRYMDSGRTKFEPATGIGDQAYFYEQDAMKESHVAGIFTRVGQHVLTISMDVNTPQTADTIRPLVVALSKAAVAKLQ